MDDDEERRSVGRPASGGENLNIVRTGRGQGRPKKDVAAKRAGDSENGSDSPKKRGRPASSGKAAPAYQPTGKPRGRPKTTADKESLDEDDEKDDEDEEPSKDAENSADEDEGNDKVLSGSEDAI